MPNYVHTTSYGWIAADLRNVVKDLDRIQEFTDEVITEVEPALAHYHLKKVLDSGLILAVTDTVTIHRNYPILATHHFTVTVRVYYAFHQPLVSSRRSLTRNTLLQLSICYIWFAQLVANQYRAINGIRTATTSISVS